jgi:DNA polymerase-3 subunit chi
MTELRFYHLVTRTLEQALPDLLERTLERGWRAVVVAGSKERVEALDKHLWTYGKMSFLPHGTAADGMAAEQPIWLTDHVENPNGASVLFLADGATLSGQAGDWELICDLFDGNDDSAVAAARKRWAAARDSGFELAYWQQGENGKWEQKQ